MATTLLAGREAPGTNPASAPPMNSQTPDVDHQDRPTFRSRDAALTDAREIMVDFAASGMEMTIKVSESWVGITDASGRLVAVLPFDRPDPRRVTPIGLTSPAE